MKDKRQRMAFTWPYGDPQVLAYMLSAVAASGYNRNGNISSQSVESTNGFNNNQHQQSNISLHSEPKQKEVYLDQAKVNEPLNINYSSGPIMNDIQMPLHLNIKTPSPNSTNFSEPTSFSSSSSFSTSNYMPMNSIIQHQNSTPFHTFSHNLNSTFNNKISSESISPISLFIPNNSTTYSNCDPQLNLLLKPNQIINQNKTNIMTTPSSLSFKLPAFGLADLSSNSNSHGTIE